MAQLQTLAHGDWTGVPAETSAVAVASVEAGDVLFLPKLAFAIDRRELPLFSPTIVQSAKNVSFNPDTGRIRGAALDAMSATRLGEVMSRFNCLSSRLANELLTAYHGRIEIGRTSFRPVEIEGRSSSWRKDDTRLHIDSFPATPVHGRRILRMFANVNPEGRPRTWRIGDDFEQVVRRFAARFRLPWPGSATVLRLLGITKSPRTPYDALMLQLHDCMKADADYQAHTPHLQFDFPAGSTWVAFTDQVSHAALAGQYQLEQTFLLPVEAMADPQRSPLRILERTIGRPLV